MKDETGLNTQLIHAGDGENPTTAVASPIFQSATFRFDHPDEIAAAMVSEAHPQFYGRYATPNTKLIYLETPANPTLSLTDLTAVAQLAQSHNILTAADNTFATPFNQRPLDLGVDIALRSATKYLAGHSDVVAGAVVSDAEKVGQMWHTHVMLGGALHPMEAWLLQRGLKTFGLRMARHNQNAQKVAEFLQGHPAVREVYYPGLPSHPQHKLAQAQMPGKATPKSPQRRHARSGAPLRWPGRRYRPHRRPGAGNGNAFC